MRRYQDSKRLAYQSEVPVWWCPALGTVLANEEVIDGVSERGGFPVVRKPLRQWQLRITAYADRLAEELEPLDWPETKQKQRDKHLLSADFFDVDNHPDITVAIDGAQPDGAGAKITGTLTVLGKSLPISFDARVSQAEGEIRLDADLPVNRADFGMTWNMLAMASMKRAVSFASTSMSNTSMSANFLNRQALPSITGLPAAGPM